MTRIIGISGRMKSGKSTVAEYLHGEICPSIIWGFSHQIKLLVCDHIADMDGLDLDTQKDKERVHQCGKTYRQILQEVGVKLRDVWCDTWVHSWKININAIPSAPSVIVPDVRFPNEVKAIQEMGGIVIRLTRNPVDSSDETETALDYMDSPTRDPYFYKRFIPDNWTVVNNADLSIDETNKICLKIAKEYLNETR